MACTTTVLSKERKKFIENQADVLLQTLGYDGSNIGTLDAVKAAISLGFTVNEEPMSADEQGFISVKDGKKKICLNNSYDFEMRRFVLAHELGHYMLHKPSEAHTYYRMDKKDKGIEEQEADYFAACFLMPRKYFKLGYERLKRLNLAQNVLVSVMALGFRVPSESIQRRMTEVL